jgi:hypothetical protein
MQIDCGSYGFSPEFHRQLRIKHHASRFGIYRADHSLGHAIFVLSVWRYRFISDTPGNLGRGAFEEVESAQAVFPCAALLELVASCLDFSLICLALWGWLVNGQKVDGN